MTDGTGSRGGSTPIEILQRVGDPEMLILPQEDVASFLVHVREKEVRLSRTIGPNAVRYCDVIRWPERIWLAG